MPLKPWSKPQSLSQRPIIRINHALEIILTPDAAWHRAISIQAPTIWGIRVYE